MRSVSFSGACIMPEEKNTTIVGDGHDNYAQAAQNAIR